MLTTISLSSVSVSLIRLGIAGWWKGLYLNTSDTRLRAELTDPNDFYYTFLDHP